MTFKNKEVIFNEGCDVFIKEALEQAQKHSANFAGYTFVKQENLESLVKDLQGLLKEVEHYESIKK